MENIKVQETHLDDYLNLNNQTAHQRQINHIVNSKIQRKIPSEQDIIAFDEAQLHRKLTPHEKDFVHEQVVYMNEHKGHEGAHSEMVLIIFTVLLISQVLISIWKKFHIKTYNLATLLGLWLVPFIISISKSYSTFTFIWILFSIANTFIVKKALESPMTSSTPRMVYFWYQRVYDLSYGVGVLGYNFLI